VGPVILLSDAISIEDLLSFQHCHDQQQGQVFSVGSPVETSLKDLPNKFNYFLD
jgi:hypothetical protein